jgi:hypothetical protein
MPAANPGLLPEMGKDWEGRPADALKSQYLTTLQRSPVVIATKASHFLVPVMLRNMSVRYVGIVYVAMGTAQLHGGFEC